MRNVLGGTCQKGQLILSGYDQQVENGKILKNVYVIDNEESPNIHRDNDHLLFDFEADVFGKYHDRDYEGSNLYFRADDFQRMVMSGQVLLLHSNYLVCPPGLGCNNYSLSAYFGKFM